MRRPPTCRPRRLNPRPAPIAGPPSTDLLSSFREGRGEIPPPANRATLGSKSGERTTMRKIAVDGMRCRQGAEPGTVRGSLGHGATSSVRLLVFGSPTQVIAKTFSRAYETAGYSAALALFRRGFLRPRRRDGASGGRRPRRGARAPSWSPWTSWVHRRHRPVPQLRHAGLHRGLPA